MYTKCANLLTRTKSKGSLGVGGQKTTRLGPSPVDHQERNNKLDPDRNQGITGRTDSADASSTGTKSNGSTGSTQAEMKKEEQWGRTVGNPKSTMLHL